MGPRSDTLLIAFGGMRGQLGMPPFEFFKATAGLPVKRLFVRDLRQAWYHRGIPGHGETLEEVARGLGAIASRGGARRLIVTGNSAGGYAAMVFGSILGADAAVCFAPQSVIDPDALGAIGDDRWGQVHELAAAGDLDERWADLRTALPLSGAGKTRYMLFYDGSYELDRAHAERLADVAGVELYPRSRGRHGVAAEMRESGELSRVLESAIRGTGARFARASSSVRAAAAWLPPDPDQRTSGSPVS